jgi:hypothetical protein
MSDVITQCVDETNFVGLSGKITFNEKGTTSVPNIIIDQQQGRYPHHHKVYNNVSQLQVGSE